MKGPSEKSRSRKIVLLVSFIAATILTFQAIRIWVADYRVHSNRIDQVERGAALEPENAAAWDRLGRAKETDFVNPDPAAAVGDFKKAVARVPLSAAYWVDLARAYESTGNIPLAREAFNRARAAYPASALVAWSYGNFLLRQGDDASGFAQVNHAVQADPSLAMPAVSQAWHKTQDANVLLNQVLPATQDAYFQAIDFMAANGQPAGALVIWERLLTLGKPVELQTIVSSSRVLDSKRSRRGCKADVAGGAGCGGTSSRRACKPIVDLEWRFRQGFLEWRIGLAMEFSFRRFNRFRYAASFVRGPIVAARFQRGRKLGSQRAPPIRSGRAQPQLPFSRDAENGRNHDRERNLVFNQ